MIRSAGEMSMLPASMDEDLDGGAKDAMKKMAGKQVRECYHEKLKKKKKKFLFYYEINEACALKQSIPCSGGMLQRRQYVGDTLTETAGQPPLRLS